MKKSARQIHKETQLRKKTHSLNDLCRDRHRRARAGRLLHQVRILPSAACADGRQRD